MSVSDDLTAAQRSLDELTRTVGRLEQQVGGGLEIRRVRADADHLRESLALLRESAPHERTETPVRHQEMVTIPDTPYNTALWTDAEDEGLGARDRHAP
jgi:formylglycine-generating enzyme required for sulfatase activity